MNGNDERACVLDSCFCINFLNKRLTALPKGLLYISQITRMELLAKPEYKVNKAAEYEALDFIAAMTVVPITDEIEDCTVKIRRENTAIKLPDAIIAASAVFLEAVLFSCDDNMVAQLSNAAPELSAIYEQPLQPE
jgi:predicted nucleic acid-binding protein